MAMTSWRFNFIDINKSIVQRETTPADIIGYMAVRAPKGETEAIYFAPGSEEEIKAMIGLPSAHYPDIYEAIEFNKNFGLYISAPAGNKASMPSYYGGAYQTKYGWLPFYKETSKEKPAFLTAIKPGTEKEVLNGVKASEVDIPRFALPEGGAVREDTIAIKNVSYEVMAMTKYIDLDYWGYKDRGAATYRYGWSDLPVAPEEPAKLFCQIDGNLDFDNPVGCIELVINKDTDERTYTIFIGGEDHESKTTSQSTKAPFINFSNLVPANGLFSQDYNEVLLEGTVVDEATGLPSHEWFESEDAIGSKLVNTLKNGGIWVANGNELAIPAVGTFVKFVADVSDVTYGYVCQKSPTSVQTRVQIDNVNFDKYDYDIALQYTTLDPANISTKLCSNKDNYLLVYKADGTFTPYQYTTVETEDGDEVKEWVKVSEDFIDKKILVAECIDANGPTKDSKKVVGKVYYFRDDGNGGSKSFEMTVDSEYDDLVLKEDRMYNTFDLSCSEVDFEGNEVNGGSWTGSLDEYGTDQWDSGNYWEDVFPYDSVSYVEFHPIRTFDDDTTNGFYTGNRHTSYDFTISGERYVEKVVNKIIKDKDRGIGAMWDDGYKPVINAALVEAKKPKYEECQIFMECSGRPEFQAKLSAIRDAHNTSTVIAPFLISETQFNKPSTIQVGTRKRGLAYYVGEFQVLDKNVRKKYWANLIGSVGAMLAKIMDERYGGVAPAWVNDSGYGGQLDRVVLKARWDMPDLMTKILDQKGLNPIIMNSEDGIMITSHKTSELDAGDWSYLGHSMSFDLLKREIRENVMKPQLMKAIDDFWIDVRQEQVDKILAKRTTGRKIWTEAICDIAGVNNDQTKAQRNFIISVGVKVTPFSEFVTLKLTNVGQTMNVADEM